MSGPIRNMLLRYSTRWLLRTLGEPLTQGFLGLTGDLLLQVCLCAVRADLLLEEESPDDAVQRIGRDRVLEAYPSDTRGTYRQRVLGAWTAWNNAGATTGLLDQISRFGFTDALIKADSDWTGLTGGPARRIWVILPSISSGAPGETEVSGVYKLVNKFRAGEERLEDVVGVRSGRLWDIHPETNLPHTWDSPGPGVTTWGDSEAVSYREDVA